eukprot:3469643-Prymnesium_polylepis.2
MFAFGTVFSAVVTTPSLFAGRAVATRRGCVSQGGARQHGVARGGGARADGEKRLILTTPNRAVALVHEQGSLERAGVSEADRRAAARHGREMDWVWVRGRRGGCCVRRCKSTD